MAEGILVCFAVKQEALRFRNWPRHFPVTRILVTGMGEKNTRASLEQALAAQRPNLILTCGFAGGLKPGLKGGTVLFQCDGNQDIQTRLQAAGARAGIFLPGPKVASTAAEKCRLWEQSRADAVEMESFVIQAICRNERIPCATVRVILDAAGEDLPLDFNEFMTADQRINYGKLVLAVLRSPRKIPALLRLGRQSSMAANSLLHVLCEFLAYHS